MSMTPFQARAASALATLLLAACTPVLGPAGWERVVGVVDTEARLAAPIALPASARVGVAFTATVTTHGSGSCTRADGADVDIDGLNADVTPYDREARRGVCTDDLAPYPRSVTLRFVTAGEARIRVLGRPLSSAAPAVYEARLTVLP
jgi:hypothetical protein